nr:RNA-directed DNA polymerase, eukaryota, reverse transcriptase zinc-binding domain protein [Tanacetum cinerariifolium]
MPNPSGNSWRYVVSLSNRSCLLPLLCAVKHKIEYKQVVKENTKPSLVLDESCLIQYDYSLALKGNVSDFGLLTNLKMVMIKEGFDNFNLKYLGGFWVLIEFHTKEALENFKSHVEVGSWFSSLEYASNSFVIDERVVWVDIEGVPMKMWTNNMFNKILSKWGELLFEEDKENMSLYSKKEKGEDKSDDDTLDNEFDGDKNEDDLQAHFEDDSDIDVKPCSNNKEDENSNATLKYPTGFTPVDDSRNKDDQAVFLNVEEQEPKQKINAQGLAHKAKKRWVDELCNKNKVNFLSLQETKMKTVDNFCIKNCWGNFSFEFECGPSLGNSGGILYVWNPRMFRKHNSMISDYFVAIQGDWISNAKKYLIISVYAPKEFSKKRMLWSYLNHVIDSWSGETILMGDFNKVRYKEERFGTIFNNHNAITFNSFISSGGLVEVPLGGCAFTWCHKCGNKMSKLDPFIILEGLMGSCPNITSITLDCYLSDHRPILLQEVRDKKESASMKKSNLKGMLNDIDLLIDDKKVDQELLNKRVHVMNSLHDLEKLEATEIGQKVKMNCSIEGDENSKYFHGMLNKKRNQHAIRGILTEGIWIEDPNSVKNEFLSHFKEWFDSPCSSRLMLDMVFPNRLSVKQNLDLERNVRYWDTIEKDVVDAVSYFFTVGTFPKGDNASFIALIPKMQDAKVVKDYRLISLIGSMYKIIAKILANRLMGRKQTMIFKVDFEKAYDSVRWDYLDDVLNKFDFGSKWRDWLHNCLHSPKGSILVNGIPTREFHFRKGFKQGLFKGVSVSSSLHLSHLFYADDVIFMGQLSESNINTIVQALDCFYKASGLRMNLHKSKLMGIAVEDELVSRAAIKMGYSTLKTPFSYLGIKVGGSMSHIKSWDEIVDTLHSRLSKWKMKTLSIGGRNALWSRFIRALHGNSGGIDMRSKVSYSSTWMSIVTEFSKLRNKDIDLLSFMNKRVGNGLETNFWEDVWMGDKNFKSRFPRVYALESDKKLTVATKMNHNDVGFSLRHFPRDGVEMEQFRSLTSILEGVVLPYMNDRWFWSLVGSGEFSVASAIKFIDDHWLLGYPHKTRWIKVVPIKINILAWKVRFDFLPTRLNLSRRGCEIQSIIFPICNKEVESTSHVFFACSLVRDIYRKIASWWELTYSEFYSYEEWFEWLLSLRMSSKQKDMLEGIFYVTWWLVWNHQNKSLFDSKSPSKAIIFYVIVS